MKTKTMIFILIVATSCNTMLKNERVGKQIEKAKSDAIKLHDELMVEMIELHALKRRLQKIHIDSILLNHRDEINYAIAEIDKADKSMLDWMHNFEVSYINESDSVTLNYYTSKLENLEQVKLLFDSAISRGRIIIY